MCLPPTQITRPGWDTASAAFFPVIRLPLFLVMLMKKLISLTILSCCLATDSHATDISGQPAMTDTVNATIKPLMQHYGIPGMAVAITIKGKPYFFNYGVMSKETRHPVSENTLFEIGSLTKTMTATLASYAQAGGNLSLTDSVSRYFPALRGTGFDQISLMNLGTYTAGGLPLQVPDEVDTNDKLMSYLKNWTPSHPPGTFRQYSNLSIGLLGMAAAQSMHMSGEDALEKVVFPALGMTSSFINVPSSQMMRYAQGYTTTDAPVRLSPGVLSTEAYGVKTTSADLIRFIDANIDSRTLDNQMRRAIVDTHTGYFNAAGFTQDLIWEQYAYPVTLTQLVAGNDPEVINKGAPVTRLVPPSLPRKDVLLNKTGSTNGFSTYVAFVPSERIGIVVLANKSYPLDQRVTAAYRILSGLMQSNPVNP